MRRFLLSLVAVSWVVQVQVGDGFGLPTPLSWRPVATWRAGDELPPPVRDGTDFTRRSGYRPIGIDRR